MAEDKRPVRVSIYNQYLTLLASDPSEAEALANRVDELMRQIAAHGGNVDTAKAAMLACMHLADELNARERQIAELKKQIHSKSGELASLLDRALA